PITRRDRRSRRPPRPALAALLATVAVTSLVVGSRKSGAVARAERAPAAPVLVCGECDDAETSATLSIHRLGPMITLFGDLDNLEAMLRTRLEHFRAIASAAGEECGTQVRLALVLEQQGRYAEAERLFRDSLDDDRSAPYRRLITMVRIARCVG